MDVFSLRDTVVGEYKQFATSFTTIFAPDLKARIEEIYAASRYWPEPLLQLNPSYRRGKTVEELVASGVLDRVCADVFRTDPTEAQPRGESLLLHLHQQQAIGIADAGRSFVVTTGTGSGKSLCFFIPVVNAVLRDKRRGGGKRTRAIVIYPMNALANSQQEELEKYLSHVEGPRPVTFARYTGQDEAEERRRISEDPPDILLTNFVMLELLMTRQDELDQRVIGNCKGLDFLVLDELHTYRGRQGADVALLVRRVREQLASPELRCIGTSATMASGGTLVEKNRAVAEVASKLFAASIAESDVVVESLDRATNVELTSDRVKPLLAKAIDSGVPPTISDAELREHPLAVWVETTLGIAWNQTDQRWERAKPRTLARAAEDLARDSGRPEHQCRDALRALLLASSTPENARIGKTGVNDRSFFAFKLHQFISGAGNAFATLEAPGRRRVTVDGQQYLPDSSSEKEPKRLYPIHFCRRCGHEYHPVKRVTDGAVQQILARDIDDAPIARQDDALPPDGSADDDAVSDGEEYGFLTLHPPDPEFTFTGAIEDYPDAWLELAADGTPRLSRSYRAAQAQQFRVEPTGATGSGLLAWFLPGKFRFCLRCGDVQATSARDRTRLASLSAEGRSSATTVLVASALRWMHGPGSSDLASEKRKLLGFTDNRQDAALQAGHFNDFMFVSLVRAGFLRALEAAGDEGLRADQLGDAQQRALGFDSAHPALRAEWLLDPSLKGLAIQEAERTLREVLAYRVWFDQRRGWRYTNPNLEQLQLVEVDYAGLGDLAADDGLFEKAPAPLKRARPEVRAAVYRKMFDHLRQWMAIRSSLLISTAVDALKSQSYSRLKAPWGFGPDEQPRTARWLLLSAPKKKETKLRDEDLIVRGSSRSGLGRLLRDRALWGGDGTVRAMKPKEFDEVVRALLSAAMTHGLISEEPTPFEDQSGYRLVDAAVVFKAKRSGPEGEARDSAPANTFFRDLYRNLAALLGSPGHPLFGFEAREHTAQVEQDTRQVREKRFRFGKKEAEELAADEKALREMGEKGRFLPVLFCSPTMELGVDISALNTVYLRNVPPTPANYAQRSGRAGRSGQAALVLAYCSAQSPHDQWFFGRQQEMVHGEVRPPLLELANRDLVESHLQAVWLACTRQPLQRSIAELLVLDASGRPLREDLTAALTAPGVADEAAARIGRVLALLEPELRRRDVRWYTSRDAFAADVVRSAPARFDEAFQRWRDLLSAAEDQRDAARRIMDRHSATPADKRAAKEREFQAYNQISLLRKGDSAVSSDFYTYRYLATEGFLPGYNFPRLPLMAYVSGGDGGGRQAFLQRPRFLALSEFGPRSLVYHEGRAYRVVRALLSLGGRDSTTPEAQLPTRSVRICTRCGAGHFSEARSTCHGCGASLGTAEIVNHVFRIENVATLPAERITANEEERQRQGFELQTTFEWAVREGAPDHQRGAAADAIGEVARLVYGTGATITRINKGLRRRAVKTQFGFKIDPVTGYWAKNLDEDPNKPDDPTAAPRQWIVPYVDDHKNALLMQPAESDLSPVTLATVQHALLRGLEIRFQLEQGEILAEPMPSRDARNGFLLYEATEGGAGVLSQFVEDPGVVADVALRALQVMHFDVGGDRDLPEREDALADASGTRCVAACYRCLMSYYNQPDHELLDRRDPKARELLLRLVRSATTLAPLAAMAAEPKAPVPASIDRVAPPLAPSVGRPQPARSRGAPPDGAHAAWLAAAAARGVPGPDTTPLPDAPAALVWREDRVAVFVGAPDPAAADRLADRGFHVVTFDGLEAAWDEPFARLSRALGR